MEARWRAFETHENEIRESRKLRKLAATSRELSAHITQRLTGGRWFCGLCGCWHAAGECPKRFDRSVEYIERRKAHAFGRSDEYRDGVFGNLAFYINSQGELVERYIGDPELGPHVRRFADAAGMGHNAGPPLGEEPLSEEQKKLLVDHLPLVRGVARKYARRSQNWRDDLYTCLLEKARVLLVRDYDPNRGVPFGAFLKPRLMGTAREYIRNSASVVTIDPNKFEIVLRDKTRKLRKQSGDDIQSGRPTSGKRVNINRSGGRFCLEHKDQERKKLDGATAQFLSRGGIIRRYGEPCIPEFLKAALAKLNARQQAVYRGTVLTEPPVSRHRLALELGIRDVTQISRIKRQAERKIAKSVKGKLSPPDGI